MTEMKFAPDNDNGVVSICYHWNRPGSTRPFQVRLAGFRAPGGLLSSRRPQPATGPHGGPTNPACAGSHKHRTPMRSYAGARVRPLVGTTTPNSLLAPFDGRSNRWDS